LKIALESQTKAFLAEIDKKFAAHDTKWESRIDDLERSTASAVDQFYDLKSDIHTDVANQLDFFIASSSARAEQVATATATRVAALESATVAFEAWRSGLESAVDEVKKSVKSVQAVVAKLAQPWESAPRDPPYPQPGILCAMGRSPRAHLPDIRPTTQMGTASTITTGRLYLVEFSPIPTSRTMVRSSLTLLPSHISSGPHITMMIDTH
jgi:hypothetical protein